jgi:DNA-directed RNA polymerase specialized sigma54-like protein
MGKHLTIENKIQLLKIKESNSKETNEKVAKIFYDVHNIHVSETTVRNLVIDREKIKASANLQITVEKNMQNTDEIEFMDYLDAKLTDLSVIADINQQIIKAVITDLKDSGYFEYSRHLASAKFGKKWIRGFMRNYGYAFRKNTGLLAEVPESSLKMEREKLNKSGCLFQN